MQVLRRAARPLSEEDNDRSTGRVSATAPSIGMFTVDAVGAGVMLAVEARYCEISCRRPVSLRPRLRNVRSTEVPMLATARAWRRSARTLIAAKPGRRGKYAARKRWRAASILRA